MVDWHRFTPSDFEYDFERDELAEHGVTFNEAVECFFQISRSGEINGTAIGINCWAERLAEEDLRSFSNSNRTTLFASLQAGHYDESEEEIGTQVEAHPGSDR